MRERASGGGAATYYSIADVAREEFARGEVASEIPACHIWYGFYLLPTFSILDESIK